MQKEENFEAEGLKEDINKLKAKIQPYSRPIIYLGIIIFLILLLFVGYGLGGWTICRQLDGFLDDKFNCNLEYYPERECKQQLNRLFLPFENGTFT